MMIRAGMKRSTNKYCFLQVSFLIQLDLKSLDPVRPSRVVKDTKLMYLGKAWRLNERHLVSHFEII